MTPKLIAQGAEAKILLSKSHQNIYISIDIL